MMSPPDKLFLTLSYRRVDHCPIANHITLVIVTVRTKIEEVNVCERIHLSLQVLCHHLMMYIFH